MSKPRIAIDGPAGVGKSSLARALASQLGLHYIDTGAIYRIAAIQLQKAGYDIQTLWQQPAQLNVFLDELAALDIQQCFADVDLMRVIRQPDISQLASQLAAKPEIRQRLLPLQQGLAQQAGIIMEGRDIGTVIMPHADYKIFLKASLKARVVRRAKDLSATQGNVDEQHIKQEIAQRDARDSQRQHAPLKIAEDAVVFDTSDLSFEQVLEKVLAHVASSTAP